jgi:hypothetical protein
MVFNTTVNDISIISCWSVLLVEETRSDSEDDFGDEQVTDTDKTPSVKIEDAELGSVGLLNSKLKNGHGHGYNFRQPQKKGQDRMCSICCSRVQHFLIQHPLF